MFPFGNDDRDNPQWVPPGSDDNLMNLPGMTDWVWRGGPPPVARNLPVYGTDNIGDFQRVEYAGPGSGGSPAKASRFVDPRTGKFDYWGWLDAGMANLGKGGVLFEDDTPEIMERNAVLDKPAAMIAAGAPENHAMPEETRFEAGQTGRNENLLQPVAMKAGEEVTPAKDAAPSAPAQEVAPPVPSGQDQRLPEPLPDEYTGLPITDEGWKATPWGQGTSFPENQSQVDKAAPAINKTYRPWRDPKDEQIAQMINWVAQYHGLDPLLFQRLIQIESEYNSNKVSPKGAQGLGQLMPGTAKELKVENPFDPFQNLMGAARNFRNHLDATGGNVRDALWRYNAGQGNYARGVFPNETKKYIQEVTRQPLPEGYGARKNEQP